jgi:hypothetical protein
MNAHVTSSWWAIVIGPTVGLMLFAWTEFEARLADDVSADRPSTNSSNGHLAATANNARGNDDDQAKPGGPYPPVIGIPVASAGGTEAGNADLDFVLGVEINGQARAYPLDMLNSPRRHVLNDSLGGQAIAVTWCGISRSPIVYSRRVSDRDLVFFVTGDIHNENLLFKDSETGSEWPQLSGIAASGPLKGKTLERLPSVWTDWKTWRSKHPDTTVAALSRMTDDLRHRPWYTDSYFEAYYFSTFQWGLARNGKALSWPFPNLTREPVVNDSFDDLSLVVVFDAWTSTVTAFDRHVGGQVLTFHSTKDGLTDVPTGSLWDPITGKAKHGPLAGRRLTPVSGIVSQTSTWRIFHPESQVRQSKSS